MIKINLSFTYPKYSKYEYANALKKVWQIKIIAHLLEDCQLEVKLILQKKKHLLNAHRCC